jgi:photosystem II stability/assembly factor-like uncharacterized protein
MLFRSPGASRFSLGRVRTVAACAEKKRDAFWLKQFSEQREASASPPTSGLPLQIVPTTDSGIISPLTRVSGNGVKQLKKFGSRRENCVFTCVFLLLTSLLFALASVAQSVPAELINGLKWRLIGPFRGGRAVAVAGVPGDSSTFYFGAVNGGIWKTTDAGIVWKPIFDGQPVASIGALAVAPSDPKTIYAGTGESDIREDLSSGNGVYKSTDAGATWQHIGLDDTRQISRIVIDPQNANVVYVGALGHAFGPNDQRGVYKSVDGGEHWTRALDLGPEIGISDLAICSSNPQVLFAGAWHVRRPPWSTYAPTEGPGSGLYRSQDAGKTWAHLRGNGLPEGDWGRVGVDIASDGKRVYALIVLQSDSSTESRKSGLYRSDDGGNTWVVANSAPPLTSRAWYFNRITVDPNNPDVIYMPNVALYRSEDSGKTVSVLRGAPGGDDYHQLWIDPKNSSSMVLGTDQGTTISLNRGQTWSSWYNQPTAQLYHVTTDNLFPYTVYGAQQDSGSAAVPSRTDHGLITPRDWFLPGSSESGYLVVDANDPDIIYLSGTYGSISRFNRRTGLSQDITPWPATSFDAGINERKYRDPWTPVLVRSPLNPGTLYLGTQYVMTTTDGGLHWETISPDLTGSTNEKSPSPPNEPQTSHVAPTLESAKNEGYGVVFTIAPSPLDRDLIWTGSDTGLIHLTRDGGRNWKNVTPQGMAVWSQVSLIEASHFDPAVAYAAVNRSRVDDQTPYLYRTRDYGATWQPITNGLAAPAFLRAVHEDPQTKGHLFAGTEFGIYVSFDDGDHWQSLQLNLPVTSVRDLTIHGDDLVIATYGRSFWILDNISPLRQVQTRQAQTVDASAGKDPWLYRPATTVRVDNDSFYGTPLPPEEPTAENPPNGAMIDYFLPSAAHTVMLEVFDADENLVRQFSSEGHSPEKIPAHYLPIPVAERWFPKPEVLDKAAGMHRVVWDLAWGTSGGPTSDEDADYHRPSGPKAVPGTYQVRLTVDGKTQSQPLTIVMDPRSPATPEILALKLQLGKQIFAEVTESRRALADMSSLRKQLADIQKMLEQEPAAAKNAQIKPALSDAQSAIVKIATGKEHGGQAGPGLEDASAALVSTLRVVESGDREVPSQAIAVYKESSQQVKTLIAEWTRFKQTNLAQLNQKLHEAGLGPVSISKVE